MFAGINSFMVSEQFYTKLVQILKNLGTAHFAKQSFVIHNCYNCGPYQKTKKQKTKVLQGKITQMLTSSHCWAILIRVSNHHMFRLWFKAKPGLRWVNPTSLLPYEVWVGVAGSSGFLVLPVARHRLAWHILLLCDW